MKVPTHCLSHLVKFLFIDLLCDEGGGWVEADPGPEVRVAGEPGHQVSSPAGPHTPEHLRPLGPGVREDLVADLRLEGAVPVGLGDQPLREVWGGDSLTRQFPVLVCSCVSVSYPPVPPEEVWQDDEVS